MLEISKFKLIDFGAGGIEIEGREATPFVKGYHVLDDIKRRRKIGLPHEVIMKIQELKYYFLNLTGHWIDPFNDYFDLHTLEIKSGDPTLIKKKGFELLHNIWSRTSVTGMSITETGFFITGTINVVENKTIGITTPFITEEDDLGFFTDAYQKIEECTKLIISSLSHPSIEAAKEHLSVAESKDLSDAQVEQIVLEKLEAHHGVTKFENIDPELPEHKEEKKNVTKKSGDVRKSGSIDGANLPRANLESEYEPGNSNDEDPRDIQAKKNIISKGKMPRPASEGEFKSGGKHPGDNVTPKELENLEYSEDAEGNNQKAKGKEEWED